MLYAPKGVHEHLIIALLSPLGALVCLMGRYRLSHPRDRFIPPLPVISAGNLTAGGTGKTPLIAALAERFDKPAIILRGYGRKSRGCQVVAHQKSLFLDTLKSGDEAALYARLLPGATVIVSEDRIQGIEKAHQLGATIAFLDDAFRHRHIDKLDLLLRPTPAPQNHRCLPAGPYRLPPAAEKLADLTLQEGVDFTRQVRVTNPSERMVLFTAIGRPERLDPFLPSLVGRCYFADHHPFSRKEALDALKKHHATSLLVTQKDAVKLADFDLPLSLLSLRLDVAETVHQRVADYALQKGGVGTISLKN